jgi:hypothetical protein
LSIEGYKGLKGESGMLATQGDSILRETDAEHVALVVGFVGNGDAGGIGVRV